MDTSELSDPSRVLPELLAVLRKNDRMVRAAKAAVRETGVLLVAGAEEEHATTTASTVAYSTALPTNMPNTSISQQSNSAMPLPSRPVGFPTRVGPSTVQFGSGEDSTSPYTSPYTLTHILPQHAIDDILNVISHAFPFLRSRSGAGTADDGDAVTRDSTACAVFDAEMSRDSFASAYTASSCPASAADNDEQGAGATPGRSQDPKGQRPDTGQRVSGNKRKARNYLPERVDCDCEDSHVPGLSSCHLCMTTPMICCDECNRWMHLPCIGLQDTDIPIGAFQCSRCSKARKVRRNRSLVKPTTTQTISFLAFDIKSGVTLDRGIALPPLHPDLMAMRAPIMYAVQQRMQHRKSPVIRRLMKHQWTGSARSVPRSAPAVATECSLSFESLPDHLIAKVVSNLYVFDRVRLKGCCKRLRAHFQDGLLSTEQHITLSGPTWPYRTPNSFPPTMLAHIATDRILQELITHSTELTSGFVPNRSLSLAMCTLLSVTAIAKVVAVFRKQLRALDLRFLPQLDSAALLEIFPITASTTTLTCDKLLHLDLSGTEVAVDANLLGTVGATCPQLSILNCHGTGHVSSTSTWKTMAMSAETQRFCRRHYELSRWLAVLQILRYTCKADEVDFSEAQTAGHDACGVLISAHDWSAILKLCGCTGSKLKMSQVPFSNLYLFTIELPIDPSAVPEDISFGDVAAVSAVVYPGALKERGCHSLIEPYTAGLAGHTSSTSTLWGQLMSEEEFGMGSKNCNRFVGPDVVLDGQSMKKLLSGLHGVLDMPRNIKCIPSEPKVPGHERVPLFPRYFQVSQDEIGAFTPDAGTHPIRFVQSIELQPPVAPSAALNELLREGLQLTASIETADEGVEKLKEVVAIAPDVRLHLHIAYIYDRLYRWPDSWYHCQQALALSPDFGSAALHIAGSLTQAGLTDPTLSTEPVMCRGVDLRTIAPEYPLGAHDWLDRAEGSPLFVAGTYHQVFNERGTVLFRQGRFEDAIDAFSVTLAYSPWHFDQVDMIAKFKKVLHAKRQRDWRKPGR